MSTHLDRRTFLATGVLGGAALLAGCGSGADLASSSTTTSSEATTTLPSTTLVPATTTTKAAPPSTTPGPLPRSTTDLEMSLALLKAATDQRANMVLSPASVRLALAVVGVGAKGRTAQELARGMGVETPEAALARAARLRTELLGEANPDVAVSVTCDVWAADSQPAPRAEYSAEVKEKLGAAAQRAPFAGNPDGARQAINAKVSSDTAGQITELLPSGSITEATRAVLVNALRIKARWETELSSEGDVAFGPAGARKPVPTMRGTFFTERATADGWTLLQLAYRSGNLRMVVVQPPEGIAPSAVPGARITSLRAAATGARVEIHLPRWKVQASSPLKAALQSLGIKDAFSDYADLSGIFADTRPGDLTIDQVYHQALVTVDEEGTEAVAATAGVARATSAPITTQPEVVRIDRPFLFLLVLGDHVLFVGTVTNPAG